MTLSNWPKFWSVLLAVSTPALAHAGEKKCDPEDEKSCLQNVMEGEAVPFSGTLLTYRRAATSAKNIEQCNELRSLDSEEADELHKIQLNLVKDQRTNDSEAHKMQIDLMKKRMQQMEDELSPRWYERPPFVAAVTVVLTVAVFASAVKTVEALR